MKNFGDKWQGFIKKHLRHSTNCGKAQTTANNLTQNKKNIFTYEETYWRIGMLNGNRKTGNRF